MTLTVQLNTILAMVLMGMWVGASVDTYGRFMHSGRMTWLLFFSDIFFWTAQGLLIFFVLLEVNDGAVRFYIFLALLCGFAAYRALFQNVYKRILETVVRMVNASLRFLYRAVMNVVIKPVKGILKFLFFFLRFIGSGSVVIVFFIGKTAVIPLRFFMMSLWRLLPEPVKKLKKRVAGFFNIVQNRIRKWFDRF